MQLQEFRRKLLKVDKPRKVKISNSYGVYDAYKYYRKNKPKNKKYIIKESTYFTIIRKLNLMLVQELLSQKDIIFPLNMGKLEVRKWFPEVKLDKDGKVKNNYPIDWDSTLRLWHEDKDAREKKLLLKKKEKTVFVIRYNKNKSKYKNQSYFEFIVNRALKLSLKDKIKEGNFDAYIT